MLPKAQKGGNLNVKADTYTSTVKCKICTNNYGNAQWTEM